ncbi:hypothetical protein BA6E_104168 [Bacteroidales bacterium 6E]|nr:hypothetical protein BA6E_104168 [Bacteroidales bacterium 6E]
MSSWTSGIIIDDSVKSLSNKYQLLKKKKPNDKGNFGC